MHRDHPPHVAAAGSRAQEARLPQAHSSARAAQQRLPLPAFAIALLSLLILPAAHAADAAAGDEAVLVETYERLSRGTANTYSVEDIDGESVDNIIDVLNTASQGRAGVLWWRSNTHRLRPQPVKVHVLAHRHYGMPAQALVRPDFTLEGDVSFTPVPGGVYLVRGCVDRQYQAVWIEDERGAPVAPPLESGTRSTACTLPSAAATAQAAFDRTRGGETRSVLARRLGEPTSIVAVPDNSTLFSAPLQQQVDYRYEGRGTLRLIVPEVPDAEPFVIAVTSDSAQADEIGTAVRLIVERGDITLVRGIAMGLRDGGVSDVETLDAFAARAWQERTSHAPLTIDTLAYVFQLLGRSGRARYRALLEFYRDDATRDDKLARYAERALESIGPAQEEKFPPMRPHAPSG